jgi:hypothetical protein
MKQILKRLELIKTSIDIEDEEIIELQVMKLNKMNIDNEVKAILLKVKNSDFGGVMVEIENYIKRFSGLVVYQDSEVSGLKLELKVLENKLSNLSQTKDEYLNDIDDFNIMYHEKLGDILEKILFIKQKIAQKKKTEYEELNEEFQEAKKEYEEYKQEHKKSQEKAKDTHKINEEDKKELKKLWKKASKLCHPDIVSDEFKAQATEIMKKLNDAYSKKDLKKVKEILANLENGVVFDVASDKIDDKELLKAKIEELRKDIKIIEDEIEDIKEDEISQILNSVDDLDDYFEEMKEHLMCEYEELKNKFDF